MFSPVTASLQNPYAMDGAYGNQAVPPVGQPLVSEGVFALELVKAFNIGQVQDEAQAEGFLSSIGIEPSNGWISDYPVTPDIAAEIQSNVAAAADANQLPMGKEEALSAVGDVLANLGLAIQSGNSAGAVGQSAGPPP